MRFCSTRSVCQPTGQTFDETDLVRRLGSHISDVLEAMPEAKIFIDLRHGSIQGDDRPSSPVRWACGGLFAVGLEGPADDASVLEKNSDSARIRRQSRSG